jgi:hypothetical protein
LLLAIRSFLGEKSHELRKNKLVTKVPKVAKKWPSQIEEFLEKL